MKICYEEKRFHNASMVTVIQAEGIINEYLAQGFNLTLRQLFYQFVARGYITNTEASYERLGNIISNARLAGLIDWNAIEDRTRKPIINSHWSSPESILESAASSYAIDLREDQPYHIEVWIEKEALINVVDKVCDSLDITRFACRGYVSQSAMWRAAMRIQREARDRKAVVFHLGDHDPSGIDMTRDIEERLSWTFGTQVEVRRIALTMAQVEEINPPPNPTKLSDSRAPQYVAEYGYESWELDALDPNYLTELISTHINDLTDQRLFTARKVKQEEERQKIYDLIEEL